MESSLLWNASAWIRVTDAGGTGDISFINGSSSSSSSSADGQEPTQLFADYPDELLHFAVGACVLFTLLGVPGNFITIVALLRYTKVRNATAMFIINLSVSDLMFCCFNLPLATSLFYHRAWIHGDVLCVLFPLMRYGLLAVSIFTVLAITLNRYIMIGHPRLYPKLYKRRHLILMIALTWLGCFGSLLPTLLGQWGTFGLDKEIGSCSILPDSQRRSPKEFLFVVAFVLPCLAIIVCYARIFFIVRRAAAVSHGQQQHANHGGSNSTAAGGASIVGGAAAASVAGGQQRGDQRLLQPSASVRSKTGIGGVIPGEMSRRGLLIMPVHHHHHLQQQQQFQQQQQQLLHNKTGGLLNETSFHLTCCESQQGSGSTEMSEDTTGTERTMSSSCGTSSSTQPTSSISELSSAGPATALLPAPVTVVKRTGSILRWANRRETNNVPPPVRIEVDKGSETFNSPTGCIEVYSRPLPQDRRRISVSFNVDPPIEEQQQSEQQCASASLLEGQYLRVPGSSSRSPNLNNKTMTILPSSAEEELILSQPGGGGVGVGCSISNSNSPIHSEASSVGGSPVATPTDLGPRPSALTSALSQVSGALHRRSTRNKSGRSGSGKRHPGRMTAKDRKLLQMILVIFVSFIVCYMPITLVKSLSKEMDLGSAVNIVGYVLIYLTTCINPIIYVVMSSEYRQAYKNLLTCKKSHTGGGTFTGGGGGGMGGGGPLPSRSFSQKAY